ncbi:hypothetical protein ACVBIO_06570 [Shewanella sp. 0m-8]
MSSPLGGLYISSLNRNKQAKFDLSSRVYVQLNLTLTYNAQQLISQSRCFYVGEVQTFSIEYGSITVESSFIDSAGLLNLRCQVDYKQSDKAFNGLQEFNLSPHEPLSGLVNADERFKITVCAKPA